MLLITHIPVKRGIKCVNCHCIYGCIYEGTKKYCVSCPERDSCRFICVADISGGFCASCFELRKLRRKK